MTGKADFTEEEWETVLEGPTSAGLIVSTASRGGTFRESFSMAKAYSEARQQHGESQLLDEITSSRPKVDRAREHSKEELKQHHLGVLQQAIGLVQAKASPEEVDGGNEMAGSGPPGRSAAHRHGYGVHDRVGRGVAR